ncbi:MAG: metallophosphoesterase [Myxococcota bacterium]|nr:metallophosphoesterase [Myxococcota bacterium]
MSDDKNKIDRRKFLSQSSRAIVGGAAILAGCTDPESTPSGDMGKRLDMSMTGQDMNTTPADMTAPEDMGTDQGVADAAPDGEEMSASNHIAFSKPPFVQRIGGDGKARLRFETRTDQALEVELKAMGGMATAFMASTSLSMLDFEWPVPFFESRVDYHDRPGLHNLQEVVFEGLEPGMQYQWTVHQGDGVAASGVFKVDSSPDDAFKLGWISDTMFPNAGACATRLAGAKPDLILHGGDLQYMTNPIDTWSGFFHELSPLTSLAPFHTCIGNHEYEEMEEFELQYKRLFEGHGDMGSTIDYSAFTFGGVRFLLLNSEIELVDANSPQHRWMLAELEKVQNSNLRYAVVAFHRPYFTFSKSMPSFQTRDVLHPIFQQYNVPIVFTGHNHCYERFEADGITYVMDGGGGALSYKIDHNKEDVLAERPGDEELRKFASRTYGVTLATINPDGTLDIERLEAEGGVLDSYSIG